MAVERVVIVGAGHAGFQLGASLRQGGFDGAIVLLSDERVLPYQRPPLSKDYLDGKIGLDLLLMRPEAFYRDHRIDYLPGAPASEFFAAAHRSKGVEFSFGAQAVRIVGRNGKVHHIELADGGQLPADLVLVSIGVVPNGELAANAGLAVQNGIVVDAQLLTSDPAISAIGDCCAYPSMHAGGAMTRLEAVQNAADHARTVADRVLGKPHPYAALPWFWSEQGELRLQIAGLTAGHDHTVLRGSVESGEFSVFCYRDGKLLGVESVNRPADHAHARRLLAAGRQVTPEQAADDGFDLRAAASARSG